MGRYYPSLKLEAIDSTGSNYPLSKREVILREVIAH